MAVAIKGSITNEGIMNIIKEAYPEEWEQMAYEYKKPGNSTFSRFLKVKGYLYTERFKKAQGYGKETKKAYQPTDKFINDFVKKGYATVRDVLDGRGKKIITYLKLIEELILTEDFKLAFFQWAGVIKNEEIKYNIFGSHEQMEATKYMVENTLPEMKAIKTQEW